MLRKIILTLAAVAALAGTAFAPTSADAGYGYGYRSYGYKSYGYKSHCYDCYKPTYHYRSYRSYHGGYGY